MILVCTVFQSKSKVDSAFSLDPDNPSSTSSPASSHSPGGSVLTGAEQN